MRLPAARVEPGPPAVTRPAVARADESGIIVTNGSTDEQIDALENLRISRNIMRAHGFALLRPISVSFTETTKSTERLEAYAYVPCADLPPGTSPNCNMFITKNGREASAAIQQLVYAHELAHCAQHAFVSSQAEYRSSRSGSRRAARTGSAA